MINSYTKLHILPVTKSPKEFAADYKPSTNPIVILESQNNYTSAKRHIPKHKLPPQSLAV